MHCIMPDLFRHNMYYLLLQTSLKQLIFSVVDDMYSWDFDLICTTNDIKCEHTYKIASMKLLGSLLIMVQLTEVFVFSYLSLSSFMEQGNMSNLLL